MRCETFNVKKDKLTALPDCQIYIGYYVEQDNGNPIHLLGRTSEDERLRIIVENFKPYFKKRCDKTVEGAKENWDGSYWKKVEKDRPREVGQVCKGKHFFEGNIPFKRRFLIDYPVTSDFVDPKVLYIDFETKDPVKEGEFLSVACILGDTYFFTRDAGEFVNWIYGKANDFDVITAYNSGFDKKVMERTFGQLNKSFPHHEYVWIDYRDFILSNKQQLNPPWNDTKLETVAEKLTDVGKIDIDTYPVKLSAEDLKKYNVRDVEILKQVENQYGFIRRKAYMGSALKCFIKNTFYNSQMHDVALLREINRRGWAYYTSSPNSYRDYSGAYTFCNPGLYKDIVSFDISSAYPNALINLNIGFDTKDPSGDNESPIDVNFKSEPKSMCVELEEKYLEERFSNEKGTLPYHSWKIIANAYYGIFGFQNSRWYDPDIAESITSEVANCIKFVKKGLQEKGYEVPEGDSVPEDEPILVKSGGKIDIIPISESKEIKEEFKVWADEGWSKVQKVIEKPFRKRLYNIRTKNGIVTVTEDHSLLDKNGIKKEPQELENKEKLLHSDISKINIEENSNNVSEEEAWLLGFFVGDGTAGEYHKDRPRYNWAIVNSRKKLLEKCSQIMKKVYGLETKIYDTRVSSGVFKLMTSNCKYRELKELTRDFLSLCYDSYGKKKVPKSIFNSISSIKAAFLDGYFDADGFQKKHMEGPASSTNSKTLAAGINFLLKSVGSKTTLSMRKNYGNQYYRIREVGFHTSNPELLCETSECDSSYEKVYDLQTSNGHFQAGIGSLIVHNTDGLWIAGVPKEEKGKVDGDIKEITGDTRYEDYEIEYEGYFPVGYYQAKKLYILRREDGGFESKGIATRRGDAPEYARDLIYEFAEMLFQDMDREYIVEMLRERMGEVSEQPIEKVVVPKGINTEHEPHTKYETLQEKARRYTEKYFGYPPSKFKGKPKVLYVDNVKGFPKTKAIDWHEGINRNIVDVNYDKVKDLVLRKIAPLLQLNEEEKKYVLLARNQKGLSKWC